MNQQLLPLHTVLTNQGTRRSWYLTLVGALLMLPLWNLAAAYLKSNPRRAIHSLAVLIWIISLWITLPRNSRKNTALTFVRIGLLTRDLGMPQKRQRTSFQE